MGKVHVLMKKEEIDQEKLDGKVVVVFDVLLATSVIVSLLEYGAKKVIPVMDGEEALVEASKHKKEDIVLIGEDKGMVLHGFNKPSPTLLKEQVRGKTVILATTNGTVAICKSAHAQQVYVASLLNGAYAAKKLSETMSDETIILVCSGSSKQFNSEDFYGVGYFLEEFLAHTHVEWSLSDAAKVALGYYSFEKHNHRHILQETSIGKMLMDYGYEKDVHLSSQRGIFEVLPYLNEKREVLPINQRGRESIKR
ncbi:2-phosphosulfolactate phosphatase [Desertibacillus haloalkaliphilus]|uniref:2-phosphosulfolactate phosphatase n=1 Tax=Desertibacillus haloalkaliphilus TaxID=1328930 RepID=UPI001C2668C7|nr:2-phosphosulfolactate phosphatase [Desertibacillus haloalkaliphilus]MBU8906227.1 2-phosphosulfolactate phosphatase [Desertibacillus haloalkaliphilus]